MPLDDCGRARNGSTRATAGSSRAPGRGRVPANRVPSGEEHRVPSGEEHRFIDVTEDLALLVVFGPAFASRAAASYASQESGARSPGHTGCPVLPPMWGTTWGRTVHSIHVLR